MNVFLKKGIFDFAACVALVLAFAACSPEKQPSTGGGEDIATGIESFSNPKEGTVISPYGETVSCVLMAEADYTASLEIVSGDGNWAVIKKGETGEAGRNVVRLSFASNDTQKERRAELFVQVSGYERTSVAVFRQNGSGLTAAVEKNLALNTYMHEILVEDYLWAEEYAALEVDLKMDYTSFLPQHLGRLGTVNIEDGGYYRANSEYSGDRYVYSNIQEVAVLTKTAQMGGLGFGPFFASQLTYDGLFGLSVAYVHPDSPAAKAGLRRGDTIFKVNGTSLTSDNYQSYVNALYGSPTGSYELEFIRDVDLDKSYTATVTAGSYAYDPVLYSAVFKEGAHVIGYIVLENFDLSCQESIVDMVAALKSAGITELILDLRFNPGGSVAQSRYLTSAIAGSAHLDDTFANIVFRAGNSQQWKFRGGPNDEDGLGIAPDLGLSRLYVIGSHVTASASELVVNSLRGIDFPVYLYGARTEGKNVGMTTTQTSYGGRNYLFSPITFRVTNAKGFGDYPDGFVPDVMVNNQNSDFSDDADNLFPYSFGDWGDMYFNVALRCAYADIVGASRSEAPMTKAISDRHGVVPVGETEMLPPLPGRYGNVIYR